MHYNQLGKTDLTVSAVSFGTAPLGDMFGAAEESDAIATVHRAYDAGINFFDSSPYYGGGLAERRLGIALRGRRDEVVIGTKVDGLVNLHRACQRQFGGAPVRYHLLTSTFSVLGNDGQADYGAANEVLNRMAQWHSARGLPWSALAWLGWAHVGMTRGPEYKQLAQARGITPLTPEEGKDLFIDVLADAELKPVTVLMSRGESEFFKTPIDRKSVV